MVTIRSSRFADLDPRTAYRLWQLRIDVFVVEQECPYSELDGRDMEPDALHLWVEDDGAPVGCLRILEDSGSARIGRVVVARTHRGRGLAAELMRATLELVGERRCVLDAQSHLTHWYARFGFAPSGPEFLEDGIPHTPMTRSGDTA
ncbi:MAG: GNAT family N-acetyltransferase [Nesterenkonia sp.]|nr:GNAT family N-acetyltransferase [Nesterenkonia sp.]